MENKEMQIILERLHRARESSGLSYQELADKTKMSKSTLQRYETGAIKNLPLSKIGILAQALGVSPAYLMGWDEKEPADNADELDREIDRIYASLPDDKKQQALDFLRFLQGK